jgi:hypothetical protein
MDSATSAAKAFSRSALSISWQPSSMTRSRFLWPTRRMTWSGLRHVTRRDSYSSKPINERFYYRLLCAFVACTLDDANRQSIDGTKSIGIFVMQQAKSIYFINKIHNFIYLRLHSSAPFCFHVRRGGSRIVHANAGSTTPCSGPR